MIISQGIAISNLIFWFLQPIFEFKPELPHIAAFPWDIISNVALFYLMNELKKYIVVFDIVAFLGFSKKFTTRLKKFTTLITFLIKIMCILNLLVVSVRDLLFFFYDSCFDLFFNLNYICNYIKEIFVQFVYLSMLILLFKMTLKDPKLRDKYRKNNQSATSR
jgi:hypothetical protein